ncbi:NAD(P)-dependent alcohol dehydrogenase [Microbacterium sp. W1N]|uniref:NAD(P)-dependent alcohol dehydrogenase n=1 Tax=Microbacterium festucae TaxID=2977531 RepID=UPI0021C0E1AE|nr:NAD(P)-dependent alcohol dehydrogenase [Microbacterium festucae]MCT9821117.1 NAD(P)-dependent alcohol dehydrogenase [Microbacterium festucae]
MRAVVYDRYGGVDRLRHMELPTPDPGPGEVLVEVLATSLNLSDWETLHGSPAYSRIGAPLRPRRRILGSDIAGVVAAVGAGVTRWRVGDEVYGDNLARKGGFAEYAVAPEGVLARKPETLTFEQASTIPQSGAIAAQTVARAQPGERMLLNGAGGGAGVFAIPLAAAAGVHLTAVDNASKLAFMRGLGAAEVIDYRQTDFTRTGPYDLVVDLVAHRSVFAYRRALAPGGRALVVGGTTRTLLRMLTLGALVGWASGRRLGVMAVREGPAHFAPVADAVASGAVTVVIDRVYPLAQVAEALTLHGEGRALGKVVVRVRD